MVGTVGRMTTLPGAFNVIPGAIEFSMDIRAETSAARDEAVVTISAEIHAPGESVYSATKAGLKAFAETLRKEVAERGLRVALVEPGTVGTDMQAASADEQRDEIAAERMLQAEDIADAVGFILSRPPRVDVVTLRVEPRLQELP